MTYTIQSFAKSIKDKYPDGVMSDGRRYSDVSDQELTQKIVSKYSVYQSQISDLATPTPSVKETEQPVVESTPNIAQRALGVFLDPIAKSSIRAGQATVALGVMGVNKLTGGALNKYTPEGNVNEAVNRALNTPTKIPISGGTVKPIGEETPESIVGTGISTVALGAGSPVVAGALIGAGSAMEKNKSTGGVVLESAVTAALGKILDVGLKAASPYLTKAISVHGTPLIEKLQNQLPDYAKPFLDNIINLGNKTKSTIAQQEFNKATDVIKSETSIDFNKARERAWQDIQPKQTPTTKTSYARGNKVSGQGVVTKAKLLPTTADEPVLESYQKLYQDGSITSKMSPKEKLTVVENKASELHQQQKQYLSDHDIAVPLVDTKSGKGILTTVDSTTKNNSLIFAGNEKAAYKSAIDVFRRLLRSGKSVNTTKGATTLSEIDRVLTKFDDEMEKFGAWERRSTGELTETDKARIQAIRDVHIAARDYIGEQLGTNNPWVAIRKEESNLYSAADGLSLRLSETVGKSKIGQFLKEHPSVKKAMWLGGGIIGGGTVLREGINMLP